ncbi:zinc finger BED domain-containing protein DAYSLEEPER-like [Amaranthus tricolor]|uniref:zinc finger BED domain-containing protein DAYSLEEPER-like n=1 Tax=Amaranthus tricolor TaxID=29722 RepID=UPI00258B9B60|nr:zinc finger BED domain-containing protein DAYSLEEPER-like [Amaranthus tricolor]
MAKGMKAKFDKYWENYSMILSMAVILDPRLKLQYVKLCFVQLDGRSAEYKTEKVKESLFKLCEEYSQVDISPLGCTRVGSGNASLAAFSSYENSSSQGRTQLDDYLGEHKLDPLSDLDVLGWWKDNAKRFPQVASMARDLLSIPITTVASESSFSLGSRILTKWRASGECRDFDNNSLEDGVEIPILRDPNKEPQVIGVEESGVEILEDDDF